jgi:Uma2 family endonuclease
MADPLRQPPADLEPEIESWRNFEFPYGWRWRSVRLPTGEETTERIPLTAEDLLAPELGDEVTQSGQHFKMLALVADHLTRRYKDEDDVLVTGDMQICWGIPGVPNPSPDVTLIRGVRDKKKNRRSFNVPEEGVRPCLIIEVVSDSDPKVRENDLVKKVKLYQKMGIPEYFLFDQPMSSEENLRILGYEMGPHRRYRAIVPDAEGRLLSRTTNLLFSVDEDEQALVVTDAVTGERLKNSEEEEAARKAAESWAAWSEERARLAEEHARLAEERANALEAENARLREELDRLRR